VFWPAPGSRGPFLLDDSPYRRLTPPVASARKAVRPGVCAGSGTSGLAFRPAANDTPPVANARSVARVPCWARRASRWTTSRKIVIPSATTTSNSAAPISHSLMDAILMANAPASSVSSLGSRVPAPARSARSCVWRVCSAGSRINEREDSAVEAKSASAVAVWAQGRGMPLPAADIQVPATDLDALEATPTPSAPSGGES
jgi:hypothetical protein